MEGEDALACVRERVRMAGGASSGKIGCVTEEDEDVDELRARRRGEIVCDGSIIAGEGVGWVTSKIGGDKMCSLSFGVGGSGTIGGASRTGGGELIASG